MLSVIVPAYNEEASVYPACRAISDILGHSAIAHEIIFVDDGSGDGTWQKIEYVSTVFDNVWGIHLSRNFGKDAAIYAGMEKASGNCCAVMDCDLQHPPAVLPQMYRLWQQGYEIIEGIKSDRGKESRLHSLCANCFYKILGKAINTDMTNASDFKLLDKKVAKVLVAFPEKKPFFRALSSWVGFKKTSVSFEVQKRQKGKSKWSAAQLIKYASENICSFSDMPVHMVSTAGVLMLTASLILGIYTSHHPLNELMFSVILMFTGGVILISLGIIGGYMWRIFDEIKGRPRYIISGICEKRNK